jgi:hypothetical protein
VRLDPESTEAVAVRVVELLREEQLSMSQLVDAAKLGRIVGRSRDWVYAHADELGARRLPGQRRSRLLFDVQEALERMASTSAPAREEPRASVRRARRRRASGTELLPIGSSRTQEESA